MKRSNARRLVAVALIGAVGLVACGGDDETTDDSAAASAPADTAAASVPATDEAAPATDAAPATEYVDEEYDVPSTEATVAATDPDTVPPTAAPDDATTLTISEFTFSSPTVAAGAPFTLTNNDGFAHTVTSRDDFFDVGLDGGASDTLMIEDPGTYEIFCRIHPSMEGVITVV